MATIKPDTRMKDQLFKHAEMSAGKRATFAAELKALLNSLPKITPEVVPTAVAALMDAADQYKASRPLVDPKGRRSKPNLAEAREAVAVLHKHLTKAHDQLSKAVDKLSALPVDAIAAIGWATEAPVGKMRFDIENVCTAAQLALDQLNARPHKVADAARNVLAYQVAVVFIEILKLKPSSTSAKQLKEFQPRGGAAYARVLAATLHVAGVTDHDISPLITSGLRLLKESHLPT